MNKDIQHVIRDLNNPNCKIFCSIDKTLAMIIIHTNINDIAMVYPLYIEEISSKLWYLLLSNKYITNDMISDIISFSKQFKMPQDILVYLDLKT